MSEGYDMLMNVNAKKLEWKFQVYVVRIWKNPNRYNQKEVNSIEMVLQDMKGERIQASINKGLFKKWRGFFEEFKMYIMSNFIVVDKMEKIKTTRNRWTLNFSHRTVVVRVENPNSNHPFQYLSYCDLFGIIHCSLHIIGEVVGKEDPRDIITSKGKETKRMVVVIADLDNNNLDCVLFGDMVDQIVPHLEDGRVEPLIVVLQFFKPSRWNEKVSVQSHFDVSKIHVNPDMKEVHDFRKSLLDSVTSNSVRISQVSGHGVQSGAAELKRGGVVVKSIEDALNSTEEGPIWIGETIVSINAGNNDWFYKSCRKCPKKVETPIGNRYECSKCGHTHGSASLRYKIEVMAYDGTGSITMLMWDRETTQLIGRQAEQIKDEDCLEGEGYPPTLDNMMDKKLLFKINVKTANINKHDQVYTIMKICDDEDIVEKNCPMEFISNPSDVLTVCIFYIYCCININ
ncbi:replication protein A 70 kDa DNA-binding subunit B-like [Arachis stenosperma]|uniref:replication protein A 70 kDa DNA-binding subunit B-like n=1 Tax=Arachis stenosperma TaxID=217475 RepID=UPI0025AD4B25|nr:replication protein A 70 kDa DNA-binding subunit B-like [Arachis stenosperma]